MTSFLASLRDVGSARPRFGAPLCSAPTLVSATIWRQAGGSRHTVPRHVAHDTRACRARRIRSFVHGRLGLTKVTPCSQSITQLAVSPSAIGRQQCGAPEGRGVGVGRCVSPGGRRASSSLVAVPRHCGAVAGVVTVGYGINDNNTTT